MAMPQVDFYILPDSDPAQRALFACRLVEKIWRLRHPIVVLSGDREQAQRFDELLWRHQAASFVPHELHGAGDAGSAAVQLLWSGVDPAPAADGVLINLTDAVPSFFDRFARVSEIVVQTEEILAATRAAWRQYQQRGCALERHDLRARR